VASQPTMLTYRLREGGMVEAAGATGIFVERNGCLSFDWATGTSVLFFREGEATWMPEEQILVYKGQRFPLGAQVKVSGSPRKNSSVIFTSGDALERCNLGAFWVVANLEPVS